MYKIHQKLINEIEKNIIDFSHIGLFSGTAGLILYLWKASQSNQLMVNEEFLAESFEKLQKSTYRLKNYSSLSYGVTGVGWLLEYINQSQGVSYQPDFCSDLDDIILKYVSNEVWNDEIEMVNGLAGLSVYVSRRQRKQEQTDFFNRFLYHYEKLATYFDTQKLSWAQPKNSRYILSKKSRDTSEYNLGLAHGMPGIIAALIPAVNDSVLTDRAESLITSSCHWLLEQEHHETDIKSAFSNTATATNASRLGWCYGDLAIAVVLMRAGKALNSNHFTSEAKRIALATCSRDVKDAFVFDVGLCHGSSGLAVMYKMLYKEFGDTQLIDASEFWLNHVVGQYEKSGIKGFYKFNGLDKKYELNIGFLEGLAGIGLALFALEEDDFSWTDSLMLS